MAKIKTREEYKGSIKTIDRASIMTHHMRRANLKLKGNAKNISRENPDNGQEADESAIYAQQRISVATKKAAIRCVDLVEATYKVARSAPSQVKLKKVAKKNTIKTANFRSTGKTGAPAPSPPMHTAKIKTPTEAQKKAAIYQKAMKDKARRDIAARNSVKMRDAARKTAKETKKAGTKVVGFVRKLAEASRAMLTSMGVAGAAALIIVIMCVIFGGAFYFFGDDSASYEPVSKEVESYTPVIKKYAKEYGVPQYTELIKAVMMQESAGKGLDPMQASECQYNTKYPKKPSGIKDPEYSISCGVRYLRDNLDAAKAKSPVDMDRIKLAVQGYNFGLGYIPWAKEKYGGYSYAGAVEFSKQQAKKNGWKSYGDVDYVDHVLRYYPYGNYSYDVVDTGPGKLALPLKGMSQANISSHFGPRSSPGGFGSTYHEGLDIAFPEGTKVYACEAGTIISAGWNGGYGKCIIIDHGGKLQTVYAHLSGIKVKSGQKVVRG